MSHRTWSQLTAVGQEMRHQRSGNLLLVVGRVPSSKSQSHLLSDDDDT